MLPVRCGEALAAGLATVALSALIIAAALIGLIHFGHAANRGQDAQADDATRQWFRSQKSPATGVICCTEADGTYAEEDTRCEDSESCHYWARFAYRRWDSAASVYHDEVQDWMAVPDDVVIHAANRNGAPVVWWMFDAKTQEVRIRCFVPGAGL